jgi:hypothetical protein
MLTLNTPSRKFPDSIAANDQEPHHKNNERRQAKRQQKAVSTVSAKNAGVA